MITNEKARKLFEELSEKEKDKLWAEYGILSIEKVFGHDFEWCQEFHNTHGGSFWNWLWQTKFKDKEKIIQ